MYRKKCQNVVARALESILPKQNKRVAFAMHAMMRRMAKASNDHWGRGLAEYSLVMPAVGLENLPHLRHSQRFFHGCSMWRHCAWY